MNTYTDEQRAGFAKAIFEAHTFEAMKDCLQYWGCFIPYPPRVMTATEGEVSYVESLYDQLRPFTFEWATDFRIGTLIQTLAQIVEVQKGMNLKATELQDILKNVGESLPDTIRDIQARLEDLEAPEARR